MTPGAVYIYTHTCSKLVNSTYTVLCFREYLLSTLLYLTLELLREGPPLDRDNSLAVSLSAVLLKVRSLPSVCSFIIPPSSSADLAGVLSPCLHGDYSVRPAVEQSVDSTSIPHTVEGGH